MYTNNDLQPTQAQPQLAIQFLKALGYKEGDIVAGRNLSCYKQSGIDWTGILGEDNILIRVRGEDYPIEDGLGWLEEQNDDARGIYFHVNGGRDNASVTGFKAIFFEHDRGTHEEQQKIIDSFPIKPTLVVRTRRSTHVYYVISGEKDDLTDMGVWKQKQEKMAYTMGSDPALKDKPRLMRLPGFFHVKPDDTWIADLEFDWTFCPLVVCEPERVYNIEDIDNAIDKFCLDNDIKPFTDERFRLYQYITGKENQKKRGVNYSHPKFTPELARTCEDSEFKEFNTRVHNFVRLCEKKHSGHDVDPESAWTEPLEAVIKKYKAEFEFDTVTASPAYLIQHGVGITETLQEYFARKYALGFSEAGTSGARGQWHTCQCPAHGSTSGSTDNLHINHSDPSYNRGALSCKSGCTSAEVMLAFRQRAQDAGDPLWNASSSKCDRTLKQGSQNLNQKTPEQINADNAQFEAEKIIHQQLTGIDFEKTKQLGITITYINKEKLSPEDLNLETGKISIICSAKGTGKTESLKPYMPRYRGVYSWHTRVTLAIKMAYDLGLVYKSEISNYSLATKASFCANSAYKFPPKVLQDKGFLLFDECDQIFDYNFESLCNKDGIRPLILAHHKAQLAVALTNGSAAYMSADISQKEIDYIIANAPANAKIELVMNTFKPKKGTLKFYEDGKPDSIIKKLLADLDNGIPCFLLDDFKNGYRGCKTIAEHIRMKRPHLAPYIVEINGDTSEQEEIKNYVKDINESSKNTMLLSCSPSIISGISLTNGRFNKGVYGIINGILTPNNGSQGFARIRGAEHINIWVASAGINSEASRAITPQEVNKYYQENYIARNKILLTYQPEYNAMNQEWESPHWQLFCQNSALKNLEMKRLRYWYKQKLISDGYEVIEIKSDVDASGLEDELKEIAGQLRIEEVRNISNAKDLSFREVQQLNDKRNSGENLTLEERQQLTKYHLQDTFGDELINEAETETPVGEKLFGLEAIAYLNHRNGLENPMKRFYRNFYQEHADIASSDTYIENRQQAIRPDMPGANERFPKDIKWQLRERKLWEFLEFHIYLDPTREYYPADYQPLINKVRQYIEPIKQAIGCNFEKVKDGQIVGVLYGILGLDISTTQKRVNNTVVRVKKITQKTWEFAQKFVHHQISKEQKNKPVTTPPVLLVKRVFGGGVVTAPKTSPCMEHSYLEAKTPKQTVTEVNQGVVTPEYKQLPLPLGESPAYHVTHEKEGENEQARGEEKTVAANAIASLFNKFTKWKDSEDTRKDIEEILRYKQITSMHELKEYLSPPNYIKAVMLLATENDEGDIYF